MDKDKIIELVNKLGDLQIVDNSVSACEVTDIYNDLATELGVLEWEFIWITISKLIVVSVAKIKMRR